MEGRQHWWETRSFAFAAVALSVAPLLWPSLPPLTDLPDHIGRYHVAAAISTSADLQRHWLFSWGVVGNLGVDLLVQLLSPWLSAEEGARLIVLLIPPLWVSALIRLSRQAGGGLGPAGAMAFPLAYSYPFQLGFVNFMLAAALALHAFWLWIRLDARPAMRAVLFVPIAFVLWVAHSFGWGLFGLLAFSAEVVRRRRTEQRWPRAILDAALACLPLAPPVLLMIGGAGVGELGWNLRAKASWFPILLRERWRWYDVGCAIVLFVSLWAALRDRRFRFDPMLGSAGLVCLAAFIALPRLFAGGAYVDMRMLAPAAALLLVGVRVRAGHDRLERVVAIGAAAFFAIRLSTTTVAFVLFARTQAVALEAVSHLPRGASVLVLVNEPCSSQWANDRLGHVAGIALARRDIFENGQWSLAGQQLIRPRHPRAEPYRADPSQLVYPARCEFRTTDFGAAIRDFDRGTFTHVWTLNFPARPRLAPDVTRAWSNGLSTIYRVR